RWLGRLDANRSQMLGTVSHELRNSLTGVLGMTDVVSTMEDLEPAEARELIAMANTQALDANEIVEDLLTVSRMERDALSLHTEAVDINHEVATTTRRFGGTEDEVGLVLSDDLPPASADPLRVRQIVRNLVSNALRYGGPNITVATRKVGDRVAVTVRDDGEGVPPEDEHTIFLPYRRSTSGRRDNSSIGLGLWICRQLAHGMGGDLAYRRQAGFTEFTFTAPVDISQPHAAPDGEAVAAGRAGAEESSRPGRRALYGAATPG
ncbi:MAG: sensor histidine kinase, partial [Actinomycetota bacterium]